MFGDNVGMRVGLDVGKKVREFVGPLLMPADVGKFVGLTVGEIFPSLNIGDLVGC